MAWFPTMADFGRIPLVNGEQLDISEDDERPVVFAFKSLNDPAERPPLLPQGPRRHHHAGHRAHQRPHPQDRAPGAPLPDVRQGDHRRPVRSRWRHRRGSQARGHDRRHALRDRQGRGRRVPLPQLALPDCHRARRARNRGQALRPSWRSPRMPIPRSRWSATRTPARPSSLLLARRRSASFLTASRTAPASPPTPWRSRSRTARPSAAWPPPKAATRSRPAAPASTATAGCASSPTRVPATSSWTRSWAATSRAASSRPSTRASRRPCARACSPATP